MKENQKQANNYTNLYPPPDRQNNIISEQNPMQDYYQIPVNSSSTKSPKQRFNPIPLLLIAGVIFLFLGGIVFLTNTWEILSDTGRAVSLLSVSLIAFGINFLAERVLKLPKTGFAFYILGCIFLPLALCGIGIFQLFGQWLSFQGEGCLLLWAIIFISISGTTFLGQKNYKNIVLVWISLSGLTGAWTCFSQFLANQFFPQQFFYKSSANDLFLSILLVVFSCTATVLTKLYLNKHANSYITKAIPSFLFFTNLLYILLMHNLLLNIPVLGCFIACIMFGLFCNSEFISNKFHVGVIGACVSLFTVSRCIIELFQDITDKESVSICFVPTFIAIVFINFWKMPKLRIELTRTFGITGAIFSILACSYSLLDIENIHNLVIYLLFPIVLAFYSKEVTTEFPKDNEFFALTCGMLFTTAICASTFKSDLLAFLLILSALLLVMQSFIRKKLNMLVLAIYASSAVILLKLPHADIILLWLSVIFLLAGVIYANKAYRFLLEACCAWAGIAILISACYRTFCIWLSSSISWILSFFILTLIYFAEEYLFHAEIRINRTKPYLEIVSLIISVIAFFSYISIYNQRIITGFLLFFNLLVFSAKFCKKNHNILAVPQLIMLFFVFAHVIERFMIYSVIIKMICYLIMLAIYAIMGRILLPNGFYYKDETKKQIDFPLLAGILPIIEIADVIDWYPVMLMFLFLACYSMLYINRVKNKYIPVLMTSVFVCLTIFSHNIYDVFGIFSILRETDMKIPQILLDLFPVHLFIFSLVWILPNHRQSILKIRFGMYCFTTLCMLSASLNFGNVTDAIILVIFSFLILLSSFTVKKLRWFALGFSVLVIMTIKLTWQFWTSLHWGIYLFLAGIILIILASFYEYSSRKALEHPDEPKQKIKIFSSWTW